MPIVAGGATALICVSARIALANVTHNARANPRGVSALPTIRAQVTHNARATRTATATITPRAKVTHVAKATLQSTAWLNQKKLSVSQVTVEGVRTSVSTATLRLSQSILEGLRTSTSTSTLRISQAPLEVVAMNTAFATLASRSMLTAVPNTTKGAQAGLHCIARLVEATANVVLVAQAALRAVSTLQATASKIAGGQAALRAVSTLTANVPGATKGANATLRCVATLAATGRTFQITIPDYLAAMGYGLYPANHRGN